MRANRRYGGIPSPGEWNAFGSKILINNQEIKGPNWEHAHFKTEKMGGWGNKTEQENPWYNEEFYWTRKPVELKLKKGINEITLYMPLGFKAENFMFTFAPLNDENIEYIKP